MNFLGFAKHFATVAGIFLLASALAKLSSSEEPNEIDVVFDLEHSLIQRIPKANALKLPNTEVIQVGPSSFAVADGTAKAISRLLRDPRVKISVVGGAKESESETRAVLKAIVLAKGDPQRTLDDVVQKVVPFTATDELMEKACTNPRRCVLVTDSATPPLKDASGNHGQVLSTGKTLYEFASIDEARAEAERLKSQDSKKSEKAEDFFPADENEWSVHEKRMNGAYAILSSAIAQSQQEIAPTPFPQALKTALDEPLSKAEERGATLLKAEPRWKSLNGKVTGCSDVLPDGSQVSESLSVCQNELPTRLEWTGTLHNRCSYLTSDGDLLDAPVDTCIEKLKTYYLWTERQLDRCGLFNELGALIKEAPKDKCTLNVICNPESGVLSSFTKDLANHLTLKVLKNFSEISEDSSLSRPSSFASLLMNPAKSAALEEALGPGCSSFLRKIYRTGATLSSQKLIAASHPLSEEKFASGKPHVNFFHHTKTSDFGDTLHPEMRDRKKANELCMEEGDYDKTFTFLRTRDSTISVRLWLDALYMAEDPTSSSSYGPNMIEIDFDPKKTKIVDETDSAWNDAVDELESKYPGFKDSCLNNFSEYERFGFEFFIADDSGIDMIDYYVPAAPAQHAWFQVLSLKNATETRVH